jgi:hypothetical protein
LFVHNPHRQRCFRILGGLAVILSTVVIPSEAQAPRSLLPVDEATTRPDFFTFRAHLQAALAQHDLNALLEVVHPYIKARFGGDEGIEDFKKFWRIQEPDSKLWRELATVLALGGFFDGPDTFTAPYTFSRWLQDADSSLFRSWCVAVGEWESINLTSD